MSKTLFTLVQHDLNSLMSAVKMSQIGLPDIQRAQSKHISSHESPLNVSTPLEARSAFRSGALRPTW